MKITQLDIEGFRSLKNVSWKPGDLNVIIGPNGSGKSNLLMMLELINAGAKGNLGNYINELGGIDRLLWDGQAHYLAFRVMVEGTEFVSFASSKAGQAEFRTHLKRVGSMNRYVVDFEKAEGDYVLGPARYERDTKGIRIQNNDQWIEITDSEVSRENLALTTVAATIIPGTLEDGRSFPQTTIAVRIRSQFAEWAIYHDINASASAPIRLPAVTRLENRASSNGDNLVSVLHTLYTGDREFKKLVNSAMQAAFGDDFEELIFPPASDQRVQLRVRWKTLKREQSAADLSDGTLRFLLLLAILATPDPPPLIAIDEPETGLHPSMLPIIAEYAVDAAQRTQVIMTTHSDQFLDAFGDTKPTTTVAKWENGETTLTVLGEDELAYWLKEYSLGKLFRTGELEAMA